MRGVRGGWRAVQGRGGADGRARLPVRNECDVGRRGEAAEIVDEARLVAPVLCVDVQKQLRLAVSRAVSTATCTSVTRLVDVSASQHTKKATITKSLTRDTHSRTRDMATPTALGAQ